MFGIKKCTRNICKPATLKTMNFVIFARPCASFEFSNSDDSQHDFFFFSIFYQYVPYIDNRNLLILKRFFIIYIFSTQFLRLFTIAQFDNRLLYLRRSYNRRRKFIRRMQNNEILLHANRFTIFGKRLRQRRCYIIRLQSAEFD